VKRIIIGLAPLAILAGVSACGRNAGSVASASSPAAATSPSPSINYQRQYLNDVAASNAEANQVSSWITANPDATNAELASELTPYYNDLITFGRGLLQQSWPANAQADVHSLALAVEAEANDIDPTSISAGSFDQSQYNTDNSAGESAAQAVRADLGLPPVPN
jgi:hypothetical protein